MQGVWLALLITSGSLARVVGPLFVTDLIGCRPYSCVLIGCYCAGCVAGPVDHQWYSLVRVDGPLFVTDLIECYCAAVFWLAHCYSAVF